MASRSILIVEDDDAFGLMLKDLIEEMGYSVVRARNGREALKVLQQVTPSLVLVDLFMPEMNGHELLRAIRTDPRLNAVPKLIMTAANDPMLGVKEDISVLYKPIDVNVLARVLEKHCQPAASLPT
ncbi:MAG TPA: response regulator [Polyangia bacterium]|jgi:CheY-like chemotaxis protein|nr:response regulator [Polyangia bacterium]